MLPDTGYCMDTLDIYNTRILHTFIFSILCLFVLLIPKLIGKFNPNLEYRSGFNPTKIKK